ncbi:OadG family protein [Clostridium bowmanii]|uniref:OadG family protein n=1 Tax=Clostridium bowmanii TaxID=132925 RepID=UPI001C0C6905|nr:OadG family protein [Clostridium bowmanii]MBU3192161.1 OadG family protein [Clostridium bowmanii]MCA1076420.1 OadG family protein [Clostridium bowmanii]
MKFSVLDALSTTLVAMTIVFALLIILQYIIKLQSFILNFIGRKSKSPKIDVSCKQDEEVEDEEVIDKDEEEEEEVQSLQNLEVVAVITAALSAYLDIPGSNLKIKRIRRVNSNWGLGLSSVENDK